MSDPPVHLPLYDLPRSTLAIGVILWGVLAGLGGWTLSIVSDMRADVSGQGEGLKAVQKQTDRNTDDIRDLQRTRPAALQTRTP